MTWKILFHPDFEAEFASLSRAVQSELTASAFFLVNNGGPSLGRPQVDTLVGSSHANLKELRFVVAGGVWRVAFAFDPRRNAVILVAGNKAGIKPQRFYKNLIRIADERYADHLLTLKLEEDRS